MFSTSYKIVIEPTDCRPCLVMVTTHQRVLRKNVRMIIPTFELSGVRKRLWFGIPMWEMIFKFPNDSADIDRVLKRYPPMKMQNDHEWPYA